MAETIYHENQEKANWWSSFTVLEAFLVILYIFHALRMREKCPTMRHARSDSRSDWQSGNACVSMNIDGLMGKGNRLLTRTPHLQIITWLFTTKTWLRITTRHLVSLCQKYPVYLFLKNKSFTHWGNLSILCCSPVWLTLTPLLFSLIFNQEKSGTLSCQMYILCLWSLIIIW